MSILAQRRSLFFHCVPPMGPWAPWGQRLASSVCWFISLLTFLEEIDTAGNPAPTPARHLARARAPLWDVQQVSHEHLPV